MYPILEKRLLAEGIWLMQVLAPRVAHSAQPGQFVIVRVDEHGERQHAALDAGHAAVERGHGVEAAGLHAEQAVVGAGDDTVPRRADQAGDGQSLRRRGSDAGGEIALLHLDQRGHADLRSRRQTGAVGHLQAGRVEALLGERVGDGLRVGLDAVAGLTLERRQTAE